MADRLFTYQRYYSDQGHTVFARSNSGSTTFRHDEAGGLIGLDDAYTRRNAFGDLVSVGGNSIVRSSYKNNMVIWNKDARSITIVRRSSNGNMFYEYTGSSMKDHIYLPWLFSLARVESGYVTWCLEGEKKCQAFVDDSGRVAYDESGPFGENQSRRPSSTLFHGQRYIGKVGELSFYDNMYRVYLPDLGSYDSLDPMYYDIASPTDRMYSPLAYANNNPVVYYDSKGLVVCYPSCRKACDKNNKNMLDQFCEDTDSTRENLCKGGISQKRPYDNIWVKACISSACEGDATGISCIKNCPSSSRAICAATPGSKTIFCCHNKIPESLLCLMQIIAHEIAHTCGWEHNAADDIPFPDGNVTC